MRTIFYMGSYPWRYYNVSWLSGEVEEVTEEEFFALVGYDRVSVPMRYDSKNINRQNFFLNDYIIAYRER